MGSSPEDWLHAHAYGMLWAIEVIWVAGVLAIFAVYFIIKHWIKKKKAEAAATKEPVE